jgi:hypothetical protein
MTTSKSCATVVAIPKTSHSTTHEFFGAYRYSCADAESMSQQCLPANAASARKKRSRPDTDALAPNATHQSGFGGGFGDGADGGGAVLPCNGGFWVAVPVDPPSNDRSRCRGNVVVGGL